MNACTPDPLPLSAEAAAARLNRLRDTLEAARVTYALLAHDRTLRSAAEGTAHGLGALAEMAPTFILRSEAGYLAAILRGDTRLSYKKIKRQLNLKNLCLAAPDEVRQVTGAEVGYVALLNAGLVTIIDRRVAELEVVYGGCGVPRHTLQISPRDLIALAQAQLFDFAEPKEKSSPS